MTNCTIVKLADGREVCLSYGVPVAAFIPGTGYVKTDRHHSVTTSRHAYAYAGKDSKILKAEVFDGLVYPIESVATR